MSLQSQSDTEGPEGPWTAADHQCAFDDQRSYSTAREKMRQDWA